MYYHVISCTCLLVYRKVDEEQGCTGSIEVYQSSESFRGWNVRVASEGSRGPVRCGAWSSVGWHEPWRWWGGTGTAAASLLIGRNATVLTENIGPHSVTMCNACHPADVAWQMRAADSMDRMHMNALYRLYIPPVPFRANRTDTLRYNVAICYMQSWP